MKRAFVVSMSFLAACHQGAAVLGGADGAIDGGTDGGMDGGQTDGGSSSTAPDPTCTENGCLRAAQLIGRYSKAVVSSFLEPGVTIDNGYDIYTIRFATDGRESLATVAVPYDEGLVVPAAGWDIVGNNHGTTGLGAPCAISGTAQGAGLAGLFGARKAIGVAVDYPGLGTPGIHPYLVARSEGTSALDGLRATKQLAASLNVAVSGRYALVGLSQGGHATFSAAALHATYAPELDLRAFGITAPGSVWENQWAAGVQVNGPAIVLHAMMVYAWASYYGWPADRPLWTSDFAKEVDADMTTLCLTATASSTQTLFEKVSQDPAKVFDAAFLAEYKTLTWNKYAFVHTGFAENGVKPFHQTAPIVLYQGDADTIEPKADTDAVVEAMKAGGVQIDYRIVSGGTHLNVAFGYLAYQELRTDESIAWIKARLAN